MTTKEEFLARMEERKRDRERYGVGCECPLGSAFVPQRAHSTECPRHPEAQLRSELAQLTRERDEAKAELAGLHAAAAGLPGCDNPRSPQDVMDAAAELTRLREYLDACVKTFDHYDTSGARGADAQAGLNILGERAEKAEAEVTRLREQVAQAEQRGALGEQRRDQALDDLSVSQENEARLEAEAAGLREQVAREKDRADGNARGLSEYCDANIALREEVVRLEAELHADDHVIEACQEIAREWKARAEKAEEQVARLEGTLLCAETVGNEARTALLGMTHRTMADGTHCWCFLWPDEPAEETLAKEGHGKQCIEARRLFHPDPAADLEREEPK